MKPDSILKLEKELNIELKLLEKGNILDLINRNTYTTDSFNEVIGLNLYNNEIKQVHYFKSFKSLQSLNLNSNLIRYIDALKELNNIAELDLRNNLIKDLYILKSFTNLKYLGIKDTQYNGTGLNDFFENILFDRKDDKSRIAAVYIHKHEFLFDEPQIFNLGGKNLYSFEKVNDNEIDLISLKNPDFIEDFFGENISIVTAIVGENGVGKTNLISKLYNHLIPVRRGEESIIFFIIEDGDSVFYWSFFDKLYKQDFKIVSRNFTINAEPSPFINFPIYFSNYLNENRLYREKSNSLDLSLSNQILKDINSEPNFSLEFNFSLHNSAKLKRWINFFSNQKVYDIISDYGLPTFKDIKVQIVPVDSSSELNYKSIILRRFDIKEHENLKNEVLKVLNLFNGRVFHSITKNKKNDDDDKNLIRTYRFLNSQVYSFIKRIIFSQNNKFPVIKKIELFSKINEKSSTNEYYKLLNQNLYFVDINNNELGIKFPFEKIIFLLEELYELIFKNDNESISENKFNVDFEKATVLLDCYNSIYSELNSNFIIENYQFLRLFPNENLSSGEEMILNMMSLFYEKRDVNVVNKLPKILFLDEADLGLHPNWKKKIINSIIKILPKIFEDSKIQIIFTTHDPLILSDIPNNNIVYLEKEGGKTKVLKENERPQKSFGANITDLLADSFFIEDGLIGDFAKEKINEVINFLKNEDSKINTKEEAKQIIEIIDEPLMKRKLSEMYDKLFTDDLVLKQLQKEKENLEIRIQEIKNKAKS